MTGDSARVLSTNGPISVTGRAAYVSGNTGEDNNITVAGEDASVTDNTIRSAIKDAVGILLQNSNNSIISNNTIVMAGEQDGILVKDSYRNITLKNNRIDNIRDGIYAYHQWVTVPATLDDYTIEQNTIREVRRAGIKLFGNTGYGSALNSDIRENIIEGITDPDRVYPEGGGILFSGNWSTIEANTLYGLTGSLDVRGEHNEIKGNTLINTPGGISGSGSECNITSNRITGFSGVNNADTYAISAWGNDGVVFNNTIGSFRQGISITGRQHVMGNVINNTMNFNATTLLANSLNVIRLTDAEGSIIEQNLITHTSHPTTQKGIIRVEDTGGFLLQDNLMDSGTRGILLLSAKDGIVIRNNTITNMTSEGILAQYLSELNQKPESDLLITDNTITGKDAPMSGVRFLNQHGATIMRNTISGFYHGVYTEASNDTLIADNFLFNLNTGINVYKWQYPYSQRANISGNSIEKTETGIILDAQNTLIGENVVTDFSSTGIEIRTGDQNIVKNNTFNITTAGKPVDIHINIPAAKLPGTLILKTNTIQRDSINRTTFSVTDCNEKVTFQGVPVPPLPPKYPDYPFNKAPFGQWLTIQSRNFTNQEKVRFNLTFHYDPGDLIGISEESLSVWRHNNSHWDGGSGVIPWAGTRWLDNTTHEVGVQVTSLPPWSAGTVIFAPLGSLPVHNLNLARDYDTITEALDDYELAYDHTIAVDSGYAGKENLRIIHNGIRLVASSGLPADVTVTASDPSKPVIEVLSDNVQISGFLLSGATQSTGLHFHGSKAAEIRKSTVTGNRQGILIEDYSGLYTSAAENCTVAESTVTGNTAGGVAMYKTDKNTVRNSTVSDPEFGVGIEDGIENTVAGNTFENCPEHAIWVLRGEDNAIRENTVVGGDNAILLEETAGAGIAGNRVSGATVGFALQDSDDTTLNDCHVTDAAEDAPSVGFRLDSSDRNIITNSSIGTINSQNFRVTGVEVIGSSTANTIIDCTVTGITAPAITAA
ncbi:MAG: right-handed parallel beta-helix repeat-containing protein, partial [Methanoregula sp.]|nr:right-handed parallel beta-helix repeat-containing protein [Methanoregula sp.]